LNPLNENPPCNKESNKVSVLDIIRKRSSKRDYLNISFSAEELNRIEQILDNLPAAPFVTAADFRLIHKANATAQKIRLGTYGFIRDAQYFIIGKCQNKPENLVDYGFQMEWIILQMTAMDLGTCWLGGSFRRSAFAKLIPLKDNEIIPAITPVGYSTEARTIRDSVIRLGAGSNRRKSWSELFFEQDFTNQLDSNKIGDYATVLEMVRLAPSASNRQPWRIIKRHNFFDFYLQRPPGTYLRLSSTDLQRMDLGIAMCHFEMAVKESNLGGSWFVRNVQENLPENMEYILSWITGD
jgi:nitroreductase